MARPLVRTAAALAGAASLAAVAMPATAAADVRIDGHGFGHGVGLSQYGAYGYALQGGESFRSIVAHYYPGTQLGGAAPARLRVRLSSRSAARVDGALAARDATGRRVRLSAARTYRLVPSSAADGLRLTDAATKRTKAWLRAPVRLSGSSPLRLLGRAENGVSDGRYRGALLLGRDADKVLTVEDVDLEQYLWGVVPAEMPASWPAQALRAQAVVARSYALRSRRPGQAFDVFADTRSQAYSGVSGESPASTAAVAATRRLVVHDAAGAVAETLFHASSGGRTAAVEEAFTSAPIPYLVSVDDPYDNLSPYHDWSITLSDAEAAKRLGDALQGDLTRLDIISTTPTGRAGKVRVTGTLGTTDIAASLFRARLGLRSSWFAITGPQIPGT